MLQQIYYGAPGTGKSYTIDELTDDMNSLRTTFRTAIEKIGLDKIADFAKSAPVMRKGLPIIDTQKQHVLLDANYTYEQVGNYFVLSQIKNISYRKFLEEATKALGINLIVNLQ